MKGFLAILFALGVVSPGAELSTPVEEPTAQQVLDRVVAQLPREPLVITGTLTVRKRHGVLIRSLGFEMAVRWGSEPAVARYTIRDSFGTDLEQLTVIRPSGAPPRFEYASGPSLDPASTPSLFAGIQESDIGWMDLALSFLWWKGGQMAGSEEIKGRACHIVEVPAPGDRASSGEADAPAAFPSYAKARLWIDKEIGMLMQAEGLDEKGEAVRRLWVKSFKKIDDRWMIKDMEIQSYPVVHRTKLTIEEIGRTRPL